MGDFPAFIEPKKEEPQPAAQPDDRLSNAVRDMQSIVGPRGSLKRIQAGGVEVDVSGIRIFEGGRQTASLKANGDFALGQDVTEPATTSLAVFVDAQAYNNEDMDEGDMLLGDNSSGVTNLKWDASAGQWLLRSGTTTTLTMATTGLILSADVYPSSDYLKWNASDDGTTVASLTGSYGGALTNSGLIISGKAHDAGVRGLVYLEALGYGVASGSGVGFVVDENGTITVDLRNGTNTTANTQGFQVRSKISNTNANNTLMYLDTETTGTPAAGLGSTISYRAENSAGTMTDLGYLGFVWTAPTAGSESSKFVAGIQDGGSTVEALWVSKRRASVNGVFLNFGATVTKTISGGVITADQTRTKVETESGAATDDLDTINGGSDGDMIILSAADSTHTVVCKDGTGNLLLAGDCTLDNGADRLVLMYNGSNWVELSRADNAA